MDDFGVLVERYGIKSGRNSAPMAASKNVAKTQKSNFNYVNQDPDFVSNFTQKSNSGSGSFFNDQDDDLFGLNSRNKGQNHASMDVFDDVFSMPVKNSSSSNKGGGFDFDMMETMFNSVNLKANSSNVNVNVNNVDDDIWGFSEKGSVNVNVNVEVGSSGDLLSSDPVDEFWGKLEKGGVDHRRVKRLDETNDDLIPGFGGSVMANDRSNDPSKAKKPVSSSSGQLQGFTKRIDKVANGQGSGFAAKSDQRKAVNNGSHETNFFDIDVGSVQQEKMERSNVMFQDEAPDLDSFFGAHSKKSVPVTGNTTMNVKTNEEPDLFTATAFSMGKNTSPSGFPDDFSSVFEGPISGVFKEIEGESTDRRNLRFARYQRAEARMAQALAEMNQREFKAQQEQDERHVGAIEAVRNSYVVSQIVTEDFLSTSGHPDAPYMINSPLRKAIEARIAEAMDMEMKRWAAGKEGNLRALLSSLQQVLGPEFCWRPVNLSDLITSSQVKVAYKKATLCVHPDKVQQKGASLQQKYVAEKAFDILKEAYNKFKTEELR